MAGEYEFPEEPIEDEEDDDDWGLEEDGRWRGESEEQKVICDVAEFVIRHHCLLGTAFDLDRHIATLSSKLDCPAGKERDIHIVFMCPCEKAKSEIREDGHTSCGVFVTQKYLEQSQYADRLPSCKGKTKGLLIRYKDCIEISHLGDFTKRRYSMPTVDIALPVDAAFEQSLKEQIDKVLTDLTPRERRVLQLRFGLEGGRSRTLEEVGQEFNVTRERIRQIEDKALHKLRHPSRTSKLRDYLD